MTARQLWMGIDLGTQSVKALLATNDGHIAATGSAPLQSRRDGDRHEQDPAQWWDATCRACRMAVTAVDTPFNICGVAICGTSGTILLTDAAGRPAGPALMYDDGRAAAEADRASATGAALWARLGYGGMQRVWALPRLMWLVGQGNLPHDTRLAHQADHIASRLAGTPVAADTSNALKTGCDTIAEAWDETLMAGLGIPPAMLPKLVRPGSVVGVVGREGAEATGIPQGTPIVAGMTDGCASQLGAGALGPGNWNSVLGTTLVLKGTSRTLVHDPGGVVYSHRSPDGGWLPGGASSSGAGALSRLLPGADLDALADRAAGRRDMALPLATDGGERFPFVAPEARLFFLDGTPDDPAAIYAGITRGVAAIERLCLDYLDLLGCDTGGRLTVTGGGSRSLAWNRQRASMLDRPLFLPETPEPALGMAILAAATTRPLQEAMAAMVRIASVVDPDPARIAAAKEDYLALVAALATRGWLPEATARHAIERADR